MIVLVGLGGQRLEWSAHWNVSSSGVVYGLYMPLRMSVMHKDLAAELW